MRSFAYAAWRGEFAISLPVMLGVVFSVLGAPDAGAPPPNSTLAGKLGHYLGYYGVVIVPLVLVFEAVYRCARWARRQFSPTSEPKK